MTSKEASERAKKLRGLIEHHRRLYYEKDKPEISDAAFDTLAHELEELEQKFPELAQKDSPTQRVGGEPQKQFNKVPHPTRMNSLNDAFSEDDVKKWLERLENLGIKDVDEFYCDLKMDGLAIELLYRNGKLAQTSTRGDGNIGEDVTANIRTVEAIPLELLGRYPNEVFIRGEIFLSKKEFDRINKEQLEVGGKVYANPRNVAAGTVRQLDPKVTAGRKLNFYAYDILDSGKKTKVEEYELLNSWGIKTNPYGKVVHSLNEIRQFRDRWEKEREKIDYELDGVVVTINDNRLYRNAGIVGKAPRGAIAYKFTPREAETIVENIIVQVGRTGVLTPVAVLRPVQIGGTTVSRATLHNLDEIKRLDVKIGDTVIVGRAGDVIPDIIKVLPELRTGKEMNFKMPSKCPACGQPVKKIEDQVAYKCVNADCPAIQREKIYHFVSRRAFDMVGIGPKLIDQLMDSGLIQDSADLFSITKEDLLNLERFADVSAEKAVKSIRSKNKISLARFIYALGMPNVGEETAVTLAKEFGNLDSLLKANSHNLEAIPDIGPIVAESIVNWFKKPYNQKLLSKLEKYGVVIEKEKGPATARKLAGKTFVLTGTLESMGRDEAKDRIRALSGDISSSVSKETDYVVAGADPGSKYDRAQKLNIKILTEKEFLKIIR